MSTLKVNNLQDINGANNSTPEEVAQGRAKAWVNVTGGVGVPAGSNLSINNSFNVDSVTDNGEGNYTVTFTNALANADYCPVFGFARSDSNMIVYVDDNSDDPEMTVSACKFRTTNSWSSGGTLDEVGRLFLAFFSD